MFSFFSSKYISFFCSIFVAVHFFIVDCSNASGTRAYMSLCEDWGASIKKGIFMELQRL